MTDETAPQAGAPANDSDTPDQNGGQNDGKPARDPAKAARRKRLITIFVVAIVVIGLLWWIWKAFLAPSSEETDNAYTNVEVAQVTPLTGGPVKTVNVVNTQTVRAGQILFALDDTDQRIAVDQASAALEAARRKVRQLMANDANFAGQVAMQQAAIRTAQANLVQAESNLDKANLDVKRRKLLAGPGAISAEELTDSLTIQRNAQAAVNEAKAKLNEAQAAASAATGARGANRVLFDNTTVETNPEVLAANARLHAAQVDLDRTVIRAPVDGVVDQRKVDVGQRVQPGVPVMVVVPIDALYVDANFKEGQLRDVQPGQPAKVTSDLYGSKVVYHGRVVGFGGGSGSAFAAIPAQNATGNWIKVVQRLPTRIALDPKELERHPLRVGLSMTVTVDTSRH
ncbi:HlyD family secretion protein [Sphingobium yanoikuyae]|uniref:HlyD family secretion protein n=1 Tax=Sphingobium yanoikuyae TaxID=13690 RepID=UPI0004E2F0A2|nr:HlyD family efflux transporter periplasmic adaptor subunit [Sphingobium yanoikuyae]KFD27429.1 hemolysin D [Sphingobium yanoikuyae]MDV3480076.1 HlyD family efflux transporter periplasmic adaptor subunit [Sphingobium yanoikuyae]